MRKIVFRGKSVEDGAWIRGHFVEMEGLPCIFINGMAVRVAPETVGQWTGLYDRNGKEIFEGDIVRDVSCSFPALYEVLFKDGCFGLMEYYRWIATDGETGVDEIYHAFYDNDREERYETERRFEVIGNLWNNPELYEGGILKDAMNEEKKYRRQLEREIETMFERVRRKAWEVMGSAKCDCEIDSDEDDVGLPKIFNGHS